MKVSHEDRIEIRDVRKDSDNEREWAKVKNNVQRDVTMGIRFLLLNQDKRERKIACLYSTEIVENFRESDVHLLIM